MANDPALQALATMLMNKQRDIARPGVTVGATPPKLPAFQPPGQTMNSFAPMPSMASLYGQYQASQKQQAPPAAPAAAAPQPLQDPGDQAAHDAALQQALNQAAPPAVPQMPPSVQVGAPAAQPSALEDVWAALQRLKGQGSNQIAPVTQNFGNLADQTRA